MKTTDLTLEVLKDIRAEARKTNERIDETNKRIDETNKRLDVTNKRLDDGLGALGTRIDETNKRLVETEIRLSTELAAVVGAVHSVRDSVTGAIHELTADLRRDRDLRGRVDEHEHRIEALEGRVGAR
jgi:chromosome segregation ATPase